ncbi:SDR family oxidoreductase [uncultured Cellulomonas sp.]|uniref:SDR family oxidoreductase n=1 Tax=uncultured Cellulomonas sp. TaxID=189682 RepID=UPI0026325725|nr:SDR family oxidoreductase [uncultured Cellulomonas sp.]
MTAPRVAVTGATGHVGGLVARALAAAGTPQRLVVRDARRAPDLPGATVAVAAYDDGPAVRAALTGVDVVLLVSASESADRVDRHRTAVDAAAAAGVRHVVYTSFLGAAPDATFTLARDHWSTEQHLRASGMAHTVLRDSLYLDVLPEFAGDDGVLRGPAGHGAVGAVARADVARAATAVLTDVLTDVRTGSPAGGGSAGRADGPAGRDAHHGRTYDLTGPQALTLADVARVVTEVTGRAVRFEDETVEEAYASRAPSGAPRWQLDAWVSTYTAIARGELAAVTGDVERLTGRRPLSLRQVLTGR